MSNQVQRDHYISMTKYLREIDVTHLTAVNIFRMRHTRLCFMKSHKFFKR